MFRLIHAFICAPRHRLITLSISCVLFALLGADRVFADSYSMAGTFNGWNPKDSSRTLKQVDKNRFELIRCWQPGSHEFKFAHNGSWHRNFGSNAAGQLSLYGGDIPLTIPVAGEYRITLDTKEPSWNIQMQPPTMPHAMFSYRRTSARTIRLDAGRSLAVAGHPITQFEWSLADDQKPYGHFKKTDNKEVITLTVNKPGTYDIRLIVSDGKRTSEYTRKVAIEQAYEATALSPSNSQDSPALDNRMGLDDKLIIFKLEGHRYGAVLPKNWIKKPRRSIAFTITNPFSSSLNTTMTAPHEVTDHSAVMLIYSDITQSTSLVTDGFKHFRFNEDEYKDVIRGSDIDRIAVVADFNGWNPDRTPMRETGPGTYEALALLPDGRYEYKFLINGVTYLEDKRADPKYRDPDDQGGFNSGFIIGPDASALGPPKANDINPLALRHDPTRSSDFNCMSDAIVDVKMKTLSADVERVNIIANNPVFNGRKSVPLLKVETINGFDYWRARLHCSDPDLTYFFEVIDGDTIIHFGSSGPQSDQKAIEPWSRRLTPTFATPDWAKHALWYQIFPERFRNGDPSNDPPRTAPWQHEWYKPYRASADVEKGSPNDFNESGNFYSYIYARRYGGDLQGVREQLPYLRKLGVTAIYFNPIFLAQSLHKYDASDFRHIDDFFGVRGSLEKISGETPDPKTWQWSDSDRVFLDFIQDAHAQGFKVIIDGVFNHVGRDFWAFRDVLKHGKDSAYADWFDIGSWEPFRYKAWDAPNGSLPRLKHDDYLGLAPVVRDHIFAITRRWMDPNNDGDPSDGIDGWRLDVAEDINEGFWSDWRRLVKEINPDAYVVAEIWHEAREWLDGRTFDAVMNYPFAEACQRFFVNQKTASSPQHFARELQTMLNWYPPQVTQVLQNLFDSHDTDRVASMLMNPDLEYDKGNRLQDNGPKYDPSRPTDEAYKKLMLMAGLQMTFPNAPMIYYGDELGMYGADDPSDRKPMYWPDLMPFDDPDERIHEGVFEHYRYMIALRATYDVLRVGAFRPIEIDAGKDVFAYLRQLNNEYALVVINRGARPADVTVPVPWENGTQLIRVGPNESANPVAATSATRRATVRVQPDASSIPVINNHVRIELNAPLSMTVLVEKR